MSTSRVPRPREEGFGSPLRGPTVTSRVGLWLGICFGVAFVTGLISHWGQAPEPWLPWPTRPTWGYRVTQGLHVAAGTAAIPLLLVKLWSVYPRLFAAVPRPSRELVRHLLERGSILVLVAAAIFQLATGLANSSQWYPWDFTFRLTHYAVGWVAMGALLLHVAVKLPLITRAFTSDIDAALDDHPAGPSSPGPTRRTVVRAAWVSAGVAVLLTAGSAVPPLRRVSVFGVRSGNGPAGVPINKSARAARVTVQALDPAYRLELVGPRDTLHLTRADLAAMPQHTATLPIACVEGWSSSGTWTGVRLRDLVERVGGSGRGMRVESIQPSGPFRITHMPVAFVEDPLTLLALRLNGDELSIDHGYPARVIAPDRPGVLQTKWVRRLEVL